MEGGNVNGDWVGEWGGLLQAAPLPDDFGATEWFAGSVSKSHDAAVCRKAGADLPSPTVGRSRSAETCWERAPSLHGFQRAPSACDSAASAPALAHSYLPDSLVPACIVVDVSPTSDFRSSLLERWDSGGGGGGSDAFCDDSKDDGGDGGSRSRCQSQASMQFEVPAMRRRSVGG
eukprot:CAMPEP_0173393272 /NCGR_PEP_ID=MMETSP1356-20130122/22018_1 /TAXON_ID=77927 ORGANISM="Hemiselmis virescens, Strain PCC157" /NCGR_SAMPLE_ID=MMETSP1356 /ASSEMBLY_ACC=CAM_ASM_000847 /LENGTH=174 /DNA_ID=CAMNT_0014351271 /DNA_START=161 /DNA_END=683 /DNA_ORIENTATION=+